MGRTTEGVMAVTISRGHQREEGQGLVEYALIILFVAVVLVGVLTTFGGSLTSLYQSIVTALS